MAGLGHLCESEGFAVGEGGIAVTARRAGRFAFRLEENSLEVEYRVPAEFFRALSYLKQPSRQPLAWKQQPAFAEVGAMLDCSRNAVLTPDTVKLMLRKMALMGMSVAMLYTEDTYEIPQQPYFGYLRGRYTSSSCGNWTGMRRTWASSSSPASRPWRIWSGRCTGRRMTPTCGTPKTA